MRNRSRLKVTLFIITLLVSLEMLEYLLDMLIGDGDGTISIFNYFQALIIGGYLIFISSKIDLKVISNSLLSLTSVFLFITLLELVFHVYVNFLMPAPAYTYTMNSNSRNAHFSEYYPGLGYIPTPNSTTVHEMFYQGESLYRTEYNIDTLGRRMGCQENAALVQKKYACFMGCSFTFGVWMNAESTLPCRFQDLDTNYISYNYGMNGYGTQHLLTSLTSRNIPEEIAQKDGIMIYTYIDHHIRRVIADQLIMKTNDWAAELPYFGIENDSLIHKGTIGKNRPFLNWVYQTLNKSYVLNYFKIVFPIIQRKEHVVLTAKLIDRSFDEYRKQFGNDKFYLLIYPGQNTVVTDHINDRIKVLDYSKLLNINDPSMYIPENLHPTAKAYDRIAQKLVLDLAKDIR